MNAESERALYKAITNVKVGAVRKLLVDVKSVNFRFYDGRLPIELIMYQTDCDVKDQCEIIEMLLDKGAKIYITSHNQVARWCRYEVLLMLCRRYDDEFVDAIINTGLLSANLDERVKSILTPIGRVGLRYAVNES